MTVSRLYLDCISTVSRLLFAVAPAMCVWCQIGMNEGARAIAGHCLWVPLPPLFYFYFFRCIVFSYCSAGRTRATVSAYFPFPFFSLFCPLTAPVIRFPLTAAPRPTLPQNQRKDQPKDAIKTTNEVVLFHFVCHRAT